ncbi:hypothetical protein RhiXN_06272 [Rhizoctonia solani]|uniref:Nephrocystin 3-like N-terminal domain-containing protein n=1 Tax=Rhizoctonia solani TaxID=456999 RepID=A0A8H8SYE9_9AGAM|nr:uncharacterized protein RhiXN_06272 [Rhizoctonia solani]QRW21283.1 hypothetical protein RhiXN_06272 [Rhizoctonia solani]
MSTLNSSDSQMKDKFGAMWLTLRKQIVWYRMQSISPLLERGTHSVSPLKAIVTELADGFNIVEGFLKGNKEFEVLEGELEKTFEMLSQHCGEDGCPAVSATVEKLCRDIGQELQDVRIKLGRDQLDRFREASKDLDDVLRSYNRIRDLLQRVSLNVNMSLWKLVDASATDNRLNRIQPAMSAHYNSAQAIELKRGPCAEGTRVDVLNQILTWVIFQAGIHILDERYGGNCVGLQPVSSVHGCCRNVETSIGLSHRSLINWHARPTPFVVLDALDECENKDATRRVLDIILKDSENLPIKFVVCSRPEPEVRDNMTKRNGRHISRVVLHELDKQAVRADIETYLRSALAQICPSDDQITKLAERAGSLFIYAATAVRYIGYDNFQRNSSARVHEIDDLYTTVLKSAMTTPG